MSRRFTLVAKLHIDDVGDRVEDRRLRRGAGLRPQRLERRRRTGRFVARANRLIERRDFRGGGLVARIVFAGQPVFASRGVELTLGLEFLRALEVRA